MGHVLGLAGHGQMAKTGWTSQFGLAGPGQMSRPYGLARLEMAKTGWTKKYYKLICLPVHDKALFFIQSLPGPLFFIQSLFFPLLFI